MNHLDKFEAYYEKFLTLDELAKREFLRKIASEEPEIYTQFVSLYQHDQEASRYFQEMGDGLSSSFFDTGYEPGTIVGNYRLEQAIGVGGMAYVYKAERIDGVFQRSSAIKFIKRGIDTEEVIRRFNHERNILARLKHEYIAQLYDGGVSDDGLPYFVMEYVTGKDIISHCKENKQNLRQRLELFLQVCTAVDFAHKNLIIHRDIKPGNILIDENGKAKLTDFGIAKLLSEEEGREQTQLQSRVMTKEYASPEQQNGDFITTTSDVYQLGVLLYELVAGQKAWSPTEKKHIFMFDKKLVPSELKSIIQNATREEPEKRYNSVEALLQDVTNYLEDKPVTARGNSTGYLLRKFVKRNKVAMTTSIAIIFLIVIGLFIMNTQRKIALDEKVKAENYSTFLENLFLLGVNPYKSSITKNSTIIDLLDLNIKNINENDKIPKKFKVSVLTSIGYILYIHDEYDKADSVMDNVLNEENYQFLNNENLYRSLAVKAIIKKNSKQIYKADSIFNLIKKNPIPDHELGMFSSMYGNLQFDLGNYEKAIDYLEISKDCFLKNKDTLNLLNTLSDLFFYYMYLKNEEGEIENKRLYESIFRKAPLEYTDHLYKSISSLERQAYMSFRKNDLITAEEMIEKYKHIKSLYNEEYQPGYSKIKASILYQRKFFNESIEQSNKGLIHIEKIDIDYLSNVFTKMSAFKCLDKTDSVKKCLEFLEKSLNIMNNDISGKFLADRLELEIVERNILNGHSSKDLSTLLNVERNLKSYNFLTKSYYAFIIIEYLKGVYYYKNKEVSKSEYHFNEAIKLAQECNDPIKEIYIKKAQKSIDEIKIVVDGNYYPTKSKSTS